MSDPEAARRLLRHARREAGLTLIVWAAALCWTVGYCFLFGYQHAADSWLARNGVVAVRTGDNLTQFAGLPDWVCFGIFVPWLLCSAWTIFFASAVMHDDDLGSEAEEGPRDGA